MRKIEQLIENWILFSFTRYSISFSRQHVKAIVFTPRIFRLHTSRVDGEQWDTVGGEMETGLKSNIQERINHRGENLVSKSIHLHREHKSEAKRVCWDLFSTEGGQFALLKAAELHQVSIFSEILQAKLLQMFLVLSSLSVNWRREETQQGCKQSVEKTLEKREKSQRMQGGWMGDPGLPLQ